MSLLGARSFSRSRSRSLARSRSSVMLATRRTVSAGLSSHASFSRLKLRLLMAGRFRSEPRSTRSPRSRLKLLLFTNERQEERVKVESRNRPVGGDGQTRERMESKSQACPLTFVALFCPCPCWTTMRRRKAAAGGRRSDSVCSDGSSLELQTHTHTHNTVYSDCTESVT